MNRWMNVWAGVVLAWMCVLSVSAQQYTGMSGLIHVPSASMDPAGEARIGAHFLNKEFTPAVYVYEGKKFHTMSHYLSLTPFSWLEIGYTCTLLRDAKMVNGVEDKEHPGLYRKDRYFSVKVQPLREKKWWPSVAVGMNDMLAVRRDIVDPPVDPVTGVPVTYGNSMFANYYVAASKHLDVKGHRLGVHVAYRHWELKYNAKRNGVVGGITYQPSFQRNLRFIAEYTGDEVNVGFDWKLWKHLLLQSSLQNGKYFSGGLCFCINLL